MVCKSEVRVGVYRRLHTTWTQRWPVQCLLFSVGTATVDGCYYVADRRTLWTYDIVAYAGSDVVDAIHPHDDLNDRITTAVPYYVTNSY